MSLQTLGFQDVSTYFNLWIEEDEWASHSKVPPI